MNTSAKGKFTSHSNVNIASYSRRVGQSNSRIGGIVVTETAGLHSVDVDLPFSFCLPESARAVSKFRSRPRLGYWLVIYRNVAARMASWYLCAASKLESRTRRCSQSGGSIPGQWRTRPSALRLTPSPPDELIECTIPPASTASYNLVCLLAGLLGKIHAVHT